MTATLVFPASTPDAWAYLTEARQRGERVVPAASVEVGEVTRRFGELVRLPSIYDADFESRFMALLREREVARVLCPVAVVHRFMSQFLREKRLDGVTLIGESPIRRQVRLVDESLERGRQLVPFVAECANGKAHADALAIAALMRQAAAIYGESDGDKLAAMIGAFADAPRGDVVEIGSLMGRTAFLLLALARRHGIGPVLAVDPWDAEHALQQDSPVTLQKLDDEWGDHSQLALGFLLNLLPFAAPTPAGSDFNYLRMPSHRGYEVYRDQGTAASKEFGATSYSRKIAVLHIDGNHDFDAVRRDCDCWLPHLADGGWLILDDYVWAHGDGPKRLGDGFLAEQPQWDRAFVAGKALFLHRKGS